jgi:hypothetical protein
MFNFIECRDLRIACCSYGVPNASSSAMTMEATMVKNFGEAYEILDNIRKFPSWVLEVITWDNRPQPRNLSTGPPLL